MKFKPLIIILFFIWRINSNYSQCSITPDGFCPSRIKCIVNNNESQIDTLFLYIDTFKTIGNSLRKIDSAVLDSFFWIQTNSAIQIKDPITNTNLSFPHKLKIGEMNKFVFSIISTDTIGWLEGNLIMRLYNDQSQTPLILDKRIFNSIFSDTIPNIPISTESYKLINANDSVCSNYTPNSFIIVPTNQNEISYKWILNNNLVSIADNYTINESGLLKFETKLFENKCIAYSLPKILYHEKNPDSAILTIDPFQTELRIKYFSPSKQNMYQTIWLKDKIPYLGANYTDSTIYQPLNGLYSAILKGKVCEKKLENIIVDQGSLNINDDFINNFYKIENAIIKTHSEIMISIYDMDGKNIVNKSINKNQYFDLKQIEISPQILILNIFSNYFKHSFKLNYK